jgi:hypothetical protein
MRWEHGASLPTRLLHGQVEAARERLETVERLAEEGTSYVSPGNLAMVYASLGDADRMFQLIEEGTDTWDTVAFSLHYPEFRPYRKHPRFLALLDRLGLPRAAYQ